MPDIGSFLGKVSGGDDRLQEAMQAIAKETAAEVADESADAKAAAKYSNAQKAFPKKVRKQSKTLRTRGKKVEKMLQDRIKKKILGPIQKREQSAKEFHEKNRELEPKVLLNLRKEIKPGDTPEEILAKVKAYYPDPTLANQALSFLLTTADDDGSLYLAIESAQKEHFTQNEQTIKAGENIQEIVHRAADTGVEKEVTLRETYQDVVNNPRDPVNLFQELSEKYAAYPDLVKMVDFLLHSLGSDLKSEGPSIEPGQLHRLITETRSLQAILVTHRFFRSRMPLMEKLYAQQGLEFPKQLTFELMAKQFIKIAADRYPSPEKVMLTARALGIDGNIQAEIPTFEQYRDAVKNVPLKQVYKTMQQRDDVQAAIIECLEGLEETLEEMENMSDQDLEAE